MKDLSFHSEITKGQLLSNENMRAPEHFVTKYLNEWARSNISEELYQEHQELWDRYGELLGHELVLKNDIFPTSIPIGYVIEAFFESCDMQSTQRVYVVEAFNKWIQAENGNVRKELFEYHGNAPYRYVMSFDEDISVTDNPNDNSDKSSTELLYGPPESDDNDDDERMGYEEALRIAQDVKKKLEPHCVCIEIAGSIRRKKETIGDIEIVALPKPYDTGLFQSGIAKVVNQWKKVKGELPCKYTQRILPGGQKLDLFFSEKDNWGLIYAIRTGSSTYSHKVLARGWVKNGYKSKDGYLYRNGKKISTYSEKDVFSIAKVPYVEPEERELYE